MSGNICGIIINLKRSILQEKRSKLSQVKQERQKIQQVDPSELETRFKNRINKEKSDGRKQVMNRAIHPDQMRKV
jgi:hypothetical protein